MTEWVGEDAILRLKSVAIEIALKDLYKRVAFISPSSEPQPKE